MFNERFFADDMVFRSAAAFDYDYRFVLLSIVIAAIASYSGFDTIARFTAARHRVTRFAWCATGAVTLGVGIWSTHFIAMLAIQSDMVVRYDTSLMLLSAAIAVIASGCTLRIVGKEGRSFARVAVGGVVFGAGISLMHAIGMAGMHVGTGIRYDPLVLAMSIGVAVVLGGVVFEKHLETRRV